VLKTQRRGSTEPEDSTMKDLLFVAITVGFFAISWLYARSFDRL